LTQLDLKNLIEEIETMGRSEKKSTQKQFGSGGNASIKV
jgi:hypothetical protein